MNKILRFVLPLLLVSASLVQASSRTPGIVVAGWVEKITMLPWEIKVKVKLDTGAKTSSIHAENVHKFKRDGKRWVRFELVLVTTEGKTKRIELERRRVRLVRVKEHETENNSRVVVHLEFCMDGRKREAEFTLSDRSKFIYPVLLGRQFLRDTALIDPAGTFLTKASCDS